MDETRLVFGIDLGTTYSCVAQVDEFDHPTVQKNFDGNNTTPSVVWFEKDDKVIVGDSAKEMLKTEPHRTVAFVKRDISQDAAYEKSNYPAGADPTIISAHILKKIVKDANDSSQNPNPVTKVVITCPAYFGTKERMRTKQAGEIAGLEVLAVINEPTAAAIAYGMKLDQNKTVLVYDLGGGTFDVTAIKVSDKTITVVATDGNHNLGGYDWDRTLAEYILAKFNQEHGTSHTMDSSPELRNTLMLEAENKKKQLSQRDSVNFIVDFGGKSLRTPITRQQFDQLTETLLDETIEKIQEVIEQAKLKGVTHIDEILLVGGSSKMPQIKLRVDRELGCDAKLTDPDECVAKGAAIYALNESFAQAMGDYNDGTKDEKPQGIGQKSQVRVVNVTSKNYGMRVYVDNVLKIVQLIPANTVLNNCRGEETFYTLEDNQKYLSINVYESDASDKYLDLSAGALIEDNDLLLTKQWPAGTPFQVVFEVNTEGILHVHAKIDVDTIYFKLKLKGVKDEQEMVTAKTKMAKTWVE